MRLTFRICTAMLAILMAAPAATAEILFEGFYRIEEDKKHVGYMIQRHESDPQTRRRTLTTYSRRKSGESETFDLTRSVIAPTGEANSYHPVSSEFRADEFGVHEVVKSRFTKPAPGAKELRGQFEVFLDQAKKPERTGSLKGPAGAILSAFVFYAIDLVRMNKGAYYTYDAYSEEDARFTEGAVKVVTEREAGDTRVYQLYDFYQGEGIENFVFPNGDPLGARSVGNKILAYLVSGRGAAVGEFAFPQKEIINIFGDLPEGTKNALARSEGKIDALKLIESFPEAAEERVPNSAATGEESKQASARVPLKSN